MVSWMEATEIAGDVYWLSNSNNQISVKLLHGCPGRPLIKFPCVEVSMVLDCPDLTLNISVYN